MADRIIGKNGNELTPMNALSPEERKRRQRAGGRARGRQKTEEKNMRQAAKAILQMKLPSERSREQLAEFGIKKGDQNYQAAVIVMQLQKAIKGDTSAARFLADLTGDSSLSFQALSQQPQDDPNIIDEQYPVLMIPDNHRDKRNSIGPQAGPQTDFMTTSADICVYGGAAGGGKTFAELIEVARNKDVLGFTAAIFRKNNTQITAPGGLWDASQKIYYQIKGATPYKTPKMHWNFDNGASVVFDHIGSEDDLQAWQGSEICYIAFDELTHFTRHQFLYMLSRNRSTCGIKPYIRATCNPDADSWVADFIAWWINQDTGYPIPERSGKIRYMCTIEDVIYWGDSPEELCQKYEKYDVRPEDCKSVTFIASTVQDNKILLETNPSYLSNLKALAEIDKERLLKGNWKIKPSAGKYFKRASIPAGNMLHQVPTDVIYWCRAWDLAATADNDEGEGDYTAGVLLGKRSNGHFVVADVINQKLPPGDVENLILNTAQADRAAHGPMYEVYVPQDPGQAGKALASRYVNLLAGFDVRSMPETGLKEVRATPVSAQWQNGFVDIVVAPWNEMFFTQLESFPESLHDDMVDSLAHAFLELTAGGDFNISSLL